MRLGEDDHLRVMDNEKKGTVIRDRASRGEGEGMSFTFMNFSSISLSEF